MKPKITVITLGVADMNRAFTFYRDVLGFTPTKESDDDYACFKLEGTLLALFPYAKLAEDGGAQYSKRKGFCGVTLAHNVGSRAEVDALLSELKKKGVVITSPATEKFWGGYSGYFSDPEGYLWEVVWNPHGF